jgi:cell wall-associated NlpC family hydrolase
MLRRRLATTLALACTAALVPAAGAHAANTLATWDKPQQSTVAQAGVLPNLPDGFHGEQPLAADQLRTALAVLGQRAKTQPVTVPDGTVTLAAFHRLLLKQLGLADLANSVRAEAVRAGLRPPSRFGTEVVARQMGLRFDHPSGDDGLELYPTDPITRAEAAYSFARVLSFRGYETGYVRQVLGQFVLPAYTPDQIRVLHTAVSKIGMPYIWGGETDTASTKFGYQAHGGYDCSGFVWRVFKLSGDPAGNNIMGRTAAQIAGEIPRGERVPFDSIAPADLLFFGASFTSASSANVGHMGIALSNRFMIHSSSQGVNVGSLTETWRRSSFAWARHVL